MAKFRSTFSAAPGLLHAINTADRCSNKLATVSLSLKGEAYLLLLRVLLVENSDPESTEKSRAEILVYVPSGSLLIDAAKENLLLDFLLLLQDVKVLTETLGSVFFESFQLREGTVKYLHCTKDII